MALLGAATGGCSWLLGVSEDPEVYDPGADAGIDVAPDALDARDSALPDLPDVEEAAVDDAPVE